jgi:hypothetical protein
MQLIVIKHTCICMIPYYVSSLVIVFNLKCVCALYVSCSETLSLHEFICPVKHQKRFGFVTVVPEFFEFYLLQLAQVVGSLEITLISHVPSTVVIINSCNWGWSSIKYVPAFSLFSLFSNSNLHNLWWCEHTMLKCISNIVHKLSCKHWNSRLYKAASFCGTFPPRRPHRQT